MLSRTTDAMTMTGRRGHPLVQRACVLDHCLPLDPTSEWSGIPDSKKSCTGVPDARGVIVSLGVTPEFWMYF